MLTFDETLTSERLLFIMTLERLLILLTHTSFIHNYLNSWNRVGFSSGL